MASSLRKVVSFFNDPTLTDGWYTFAPEPSGGNPHYVGDTNTKWVRIWIVWHWVQPMAGYEIGVDPPNFQALTAPGQPYYGYPLPSAYLASVDAQISLANQNGVAVLLCTTGYPTWVNPETYATCGPPAGANDVSYGRPQTSCFPDDLSTSSPWAFWIYELLSRYSVTVSPSRFISILEFVNEPNYGLWPQVELSGAPPVQLRSTGVAVCDVLLMYGSAQAMLGLANWEIILAGPTTADYNGPTNNQYTNYLDFTSSLLALFKSVNFTAGPDFVWTHHNYNDVIYDRGPGSLSGQTMMLASNVVSALNSGGWTGSSLGLFLTEGGARREQISTVWPEGFNGIAPSPTYTLEQLDSIQAQLVSRLWARCNNDTVGEGAQIGMFPNWGMYSYNPALFDTGLLDTYQSSVPDRERPVYSFWKGLPGVL